LTIEQAGGADKNAELGLKGEGKFEGSDLNEKIPSKNSNLNPPKC